MKWAGLWCPYCGCRVRTKPRNSEFKQKLKTIRKEHNNNKNIELHYLINHGKNDLTANSPVCKLVAN